MRIAVRNAILRFCYIDSMLCLAPPNSQDTFKQVKLLFAGERQVCDQIFQGFDSLSDQCFAQVTVSSVSMLLSFGDAIARSKRSPEKLFVLLDMYEIMRELHTEVICFSL